MVEAGAGGEEGGELVGGGLVEVLVGLGVGVVG